MIDRLFEVAFKENRRQLSWKNIGLAIERLLTPSSILEVAIHGCFLGKDTLRLFAFAAKQSTICSGPA